MAVFRIYPTKDTFIANLDPATSLTRDISFSNAGKSEILNLFQTTGGGAVSGVASAHVLVQFDLTQFPVAATGSGSVYRLKLFDAQHSGTVPTECAAFVLRISQSWVEGTGEDIDFYTDLGFANWFSASVSAAWGVPGAIPMPVPFTGSLTSTFYFQSGHEHLDTDVSAIVNGWLASGSNFGFYIQLDPALSATQDLFVKKFHSRQTHFPTRKPYLQVQWIDATGTLTSNTVYVVLSGAYSGTAWPSSSAWAPFIASGTMTSASVFSSVVDPTGALVLGFPELKPVYDAAETPVLHLQAQLKDWNPATAPTASSATPSVVLTNAHYRVWDVITDETLVPFDSVSPTATQFTRLSYNDSGSFFKLYMSSFPTGALLQLDIAYEAPTGSGLWTVVNGAANRFRVISHA